MGNYNLNNGFKTLLAALCMSLCFQICAMPLMATAATATTTTLTIKVIASSDQYNGAPDMLLRINGKPVTNQQVTALKGNWQTYTFTTPLPNPFNTFSLVFDNPLTKTTTLRRALYIQSVNVNGVILTPSQAVLFDSSGKALPGTDSLTAFGELSWSVWTSKPLIAALFPTSVPAAPEKTLTDNQGYTSGNFMAYVAPWGKGTLLQNKDYTESFEIATLAAFPNNTTINFNWPEVAPKTSGVYNFIALQFGNYAGTVVAKPIPSMLVKAVKTLNETHLITLSGETQNFDVIDDLFLTAQSGNANTRLFEIEVFLHTPNFAYQYVNSVKKIGTVTISGVAWTVAIDRSTSAPDILFIPTNRADLTNANIDLKAMFNYLISMKVITGNEWFNGFGFGTETQQGKGSMHITNLSVQYQ